MFATNLFHFGPWNSLKEAMTVRSYSNKGVWQIYNWENLLFCFQAHP